MMLLRPRHKQSSVFTSVYSYQVVLGIFTICTSVIWSEIILCPIFVVLLVDTGQSSSHAVRWPTFIWSQAISDHKTSCNSQLSPSLCNKRLLLWRKKTLKKSSQLFHFDHLSCGIVQNHTGYTKLSFLLCSKRQSFSSWHLKASHVHNSSIVP